MEWSGWKSPKIIKIDPQASQPAFSTSESAPAYLFERDCFVDSFWGALWPDFQILWPRYLTSTKPNTVQAGLPPRHGPYEVEGGLAGPIVPAHMVHSFAAVSSCGCPYRLRKRCEVWMNWGGRMSLNFGGFQTRFGTTAWWRRPLVL